ncbi:hypothetical protein SAMN04488125_11051 [Methylorubrum salsuginis]|uniref:Uncharacterized protein n=2 Tax=Methylorubrum salsuginis TaxID=414703 RepID=A0A1I4FHX4_9HYPH|nr:hypothetical protein SAMN04488125_11051 [Methylorubrum salsuginis]
MTPHPPSDRPGDQDGRGADLLSMMKDRALTPTERRRMQRRGTQAKGYAAQPGTGPAGETCGSCDHLVRKVMAKVYRKCGLMRAHWTGGTGTDVLATSPACRNWQAIPQNIDSLGDRS